MRKIGSGNNKKVRKKQFNILLELFTKASTRLEVKALLETILTNAEMDAIAQRASILKFYDEGSGYFELEEYLGISPPTISKALKQYIVHGDKNRSFKKVLERISRIDSLKMFPDFEKKSHDKEPSFTPKSIIYRDQLHDKRVADKKL